MAAEQYLTVEVPETDRWGTPYVRPDSGPGPATVKLGLTALLRIAAALVESGWRITGIDVRDFARQELAEDYRSSLQRLIREALTKGNEEFAEGALTGLPVSLMSLTLTSGWRAKEIRELTIYRGGYLIAQEPEEIRAEDSIVSQMDRALERAWS